MLPATLPGRERRVNARHERCICCVRVCVKVAGAGRRRGRRRRSVCGGYIQISAIMRAGTEPNCLQEPNNRTRCVCTCVTRMNVRVRQKETTLTSRVRLRRASTGARKSVPAPGARNVTVHYENDWHKWGTASFHQRCCAQLRVQPKSFTQTLLASWSSLDPLLYLKCLVSALRNRERCLRSDNWGCTGPFFREVFTRQSQVFIGNV